MTATLFAKKAWQMLNTGQNSNSNETDVGTAHTKVDSSQRKAARLPHWDSAFFQAHGNKLRVGNSGILELKARST